MREGSDAIQPLLVLFISELRPLCCALRSSQLGEDGVLGAGQRTGTKLMNNSIMAKLKRKKNILHQVMKLLIAIPVSFRDSHVRG